MRIRCMPMRWLSIAMALVLLSHAAPVAGFVCHKHADARIASGARTRLFAFTTADLRVGMALEVDKEPLLVQQFQHVKPARGAAFVRTKLKSLIKGTTIEKTFRAGTTITPTPVRKHNVQVVFCSGDKCVFRNPDDDKRETLLRHDLGSKADYLVSDLTLTGVWWSDKLVDVELPPTVELEVTDTEPASKTNSKPATLETGLTVAVPGFVVDGDRVIVNTNSGRYASRV